MGIFIPFLQVMFYNQRVCSFLKFYTQNNWEMSLDQFSNYINEETDREVKWFSQTTELLSNKT